MTVSLQSHAPVDLPYPPLGGYRNRAGPCGEEKHLLSLLGIEPPPLSLFSVTIPPELSLLWQRALGVLLSVCDFGLSLKYRYYGNRLRGI
jgi:hypothetical protein